MNCNPFRNTTCTRWAGALLLTVVLAAPMLAANAKSSSVVQGGEFYIISSVNLKKNQLVLKRPTEVTVLMDVNDKTVCLDEKGKQIHIKDLRAGDTVFVNSRLGNDGTPEAVRIRKGYMTLEEVHRRYLSS